MNQECAVKLLVNIGLAMENETRQLDGLLTFSGVLGDVQHHIDVSMKHNSIYKTDVCSLTVQYPSLYQGYFLRQIQFLTEEMRRSAYFCIRSQEFP